MSDNHCKNIHMLAIGVGGDDTLVSRVRCKMWSCPYCAYINRVQWLMRIIRTMKHHNNVWGQFAFITVTAHERMRTPQSSYKTLSQGFSKLLKRMRRKNAYSDMPYVRVYEPHQSGALHIHAIIHFTISLDATDRQNERWLKDNARRCGGGYIADYQTIDPAYDESRRDGRKMQAILQVTSYVLKYVTKDIQSTVKDEAYPRMRVIQASQHFKPEYATDTDDEMREWRVQGRYRYEDYLQDVKPVMDVQIRKPICAADFDPLFDSVYPDSLLYEAHLRECKH